MGKLVSGVTDAVGLTDSGAAADSMDKASGLSREAIARLQDVDLPDMEKMKILLENPELVGLLEAEQLDTSAMEEVQTDPRLMQNQMSALQGLVERSEQGLTAEDKYNMEELLGQAGNAEQSQRQGIEAEMQRRGTADSGNALAMKLQNSQAGANNARQKAMQMAAQAQQSRMGALQNVANVSGQMQGQQFNQKAQKATARDAIAKANAMNRQNVNAQNLGLKQNQANQKANLANQQQTYNKGLHQQQFQNEMTKAGAQNQATGNLANMYTNQAGAQAGADAATIGGLASLGGAYMMSKEDGGIVNKYEDGGMPMYASDGNGDIVDSGMDSYAGDRVDAKINDGEAILNVPQQQRFMDLVRGEIGVDELGNDDIIEGVPKDYRDDLHDKIEGNEESPSDKMAGLEKLLEMLGRR